MGSWSRSGQAFGALPEALALAADQRPAWVWSGDGSRILWANAAGGRRLGARCIDELCGRRYAPSHPLRRQLRNAARLAGSGGTLAQLRFLHQARAAPMACRVRRIAAPDGEPAILVVAEIAGSEPAPPPAADGVRTHPAEAARSPIPAWLRARLATFPAAARGVQGQQAANGPPQKAPAAAEEGDGQAAGHGVSPPVRFLWQTDGNGRFLFVSPGLAQVVGRNAEIVGESWDGLAERLALDPAGRIADALAERRPWSGLTAWWPAEESGRRVPVELTALPVFGPDDSFQGFRGFGVLQPAEALTQDGFVSRVARPAGGAPASGIPGATETAPTNVVPLHTGPEPLADFAGLSPQERAAFEEIAAALGSSLGGHRPLPAAAADNDDRAAPPAAEEPQARPPEPGWPPDVVPSAFCAPALQASAPAAADAALASRLGEAEARLRELTSILDVATDGVVVLDGEGRIESLNGSAEALFGLQQADIAGRAFADLLTADSRPVATRYFEGVRTGGVAGLINEGRELEAQADGGPMPLFVTFGRIGGEEAGRFCAVLRDLTQWKQAEAELVAARRKAEQASSQKSDFLARVSHEIRTPLNGIIGFAEVIVEERFGPLNNQRYREYVRDIRTSGEHVLSLVNDLLDIAKIEAGKLELSFAAVQLNQLVRECIMLMQPAAARAKIILRTSLASDLPPVRADARTMRQVILNLLSNSVKFTDAGGQVIVSTSRADGSGVVLRVRDTGDGMSEADLVRALEPFRQLATAALAHPPGTGLGLPLTKALVEANRASFVISSAKGEGTIVKIGFPSADTVADPP